VPGVAAEFQNVPQRNSHVFHELPGCVRRAFWFHTAMLCGEALDDVIECQVSLASAQQIDDLFTNGIFHMTFYLPSAR
jgi:hypothetical protein